MNPFVFVILGAILLVLMFLARTVLRMVRPYERVIISALEYLSSVKGRDLLLVHARKVDLRLTPTHVSGDASDTFFLEYLFDPLVPEGRALGWDQPISS